MLAILGGSGLTQLSALSETRRISARTAFGEPSGPLTLGKIGGREVIFLARHGDAHSIPPHQVNYRANIQALKDAGASRIASVATVGGIRREFGPGALVVPDQIIDYTWGRASTFFEGPGAKVTHIDFTEPYAAALRTKILAAAKACGEAIADGGCYGATQGPRLETAAEIARMERDGADLVGMTAMPEAALAREAGLEYAAIAVVANHAAGKGDSAHAISLPAIEAVVEQAMQRVRRILEKLAVYLIREVLKMGDPRLLQRSAEVARFGTPELAELLQDMRDTMAHLNGAGLAAPQIGAGLRVVIFGVTANPRYPDAEEVPDTVLINPVLEPLSEETEEGWEGCLSVPGMRGWVPRWKHLRYWGFDEKGFRFSREVSDFHARVVQHECDHLDGILYPMRIRDLSKFGFNEALFPGQELPAED